MTGEQGLPHDPHDFAAEGDRVVVLTTVHPEGETTESANVLTYNGDGKLVAFDNALPRTRRRQGESSAGRDRILVSSSIT
jgi:hypothetical protein